MTYIIADQNSLQDAATHLARIDPVLGKVIASAGPCTITPHLNYYQALVESIVGQQLSVKAAASILKRFIELFGGEFPDPRAILEKTIEELRTAGLSGAKARYIQDLALHVQGGSIRFDHLDSLTNEEIIKELTAVKGIGEWTAHMFLMFCMGRLDILAVGDLGIRTGIMKLYNLAELPTPLQVADFARERQWHPHESIACWYIWHSLDNKPA